MTIPPEPTAPETVGTAPKSASEVNGLTGLHLKDFLRIQSVINQDAAWIESTDLKAAPYYFTADQETLIKTAILQLDQALDAVDLTFIVRLVGMP